jgi:single-strand DNA-binding protein
MINRAILLGRLGADPELKSTTSGSSVCNLRVATDHRVKRGDSWEDETEWHRVTCFGRVAENCGKYLEKGRQVFIEGRIQTRSWEKDGVKRYSTEIIANEVKFIGSKSSGGGNTQRDQGGWNDYGSGGGQGGDQGGGYPGQDEDMPF